MGIMAAFLPMIKQISEDRIKLPPNLHQNGGEKQGRAEKFSAPFLTVSQKVTRHVVPAQAGIYNHMKIMDSRLRGNDINGADPTFCEIILFE